MGASGRRAIGRTRILVVDDHPLVRERLTEVIEAEPDLAVCGEAESREQALTRIETSRPDLVITDLTLRESQGLDLIKDLHLQRPDLPVLVVTMHDESLYAERAIGAGARGYITKQEATRKILEAIRTVLAGRIYLSSGITAVIAERYTRRPRARPGLYLESLTDRELRVFELLGQGQGTRQVAELLGLDLRTVETYRARIKEKLHLRDANELIHHAIRWNEGTRGS